MIDYRRAKKLTDDVMLQVCEDWLSDGYSENRISKSTMETYAQSIQRFRRYLKSNKITKPRKKHLIDFFESLRNRRASATYINNLRAALRGFFAHAEKIDCYPNIARSIRRFKIPHGVKKKSLFPDQLERLFLELEKNIGTTPTGFRNFVMLVLMVATGIRAAACCGLKQKDFFETEEGYAIRIKLKGYTSTDHEVPLSKDVSLLVRAYMDSIRRRAEGPLFPSHRGKHLHPSSLSKIFKRYFVESGIRECRVSLHSLRHSFATIARANGIEIDIVSRVLGHSSTAITEDMYVEIEEKRQREAVEDTSSFLCLKKIIEKVIQTNTKKSMNLHSENG